ncbi:hypothetical protein SAMN05444159_2679 [Bradyrhizobium lablabi]|uniref:Uncharacterized protein n=1 Tax=Bradyrhizobium lablabi TaxID=722472 RepID=A0A1M6QIJ6_9BRAD|nr:hypothetical protein SAMN05444159_2679 [Bradyrhizobium lablabi]
MPGCSGGPVVTNARVYYTTRAAAGASAPGIPHALTGRMILSNLGRFASRDREDVSSRRRPIRPSLRRARHSLSCHRPPPGRRNAPPDDRLRRTIQYSRDASDERRGRGVLDAPPSRGMTPGCGEALTYWLAMTTSSCLKVESSHARTRLTSPACGGGRRSKRGGWGKVYPLEQRVLRRHPHPNPPPQPGEGAHCRCGDTLQPYHPQPLRKT